MAKKESGNYNPFLKAENIKTGDVLALTGWIHRKTGQYGEQIIVEVTQNRTGKTYDFAIKVGSANHRELFKRMGAEEQKWRGELTVKLDKFNGNAFVAVDKVKSESVPF